MLLHLNDNASNDELAQLTSQLTDLGLRPQVIEQKGRAAIYAPQAKPALAAELEQSGQIAAFEPVAAPYGLTGKQLDLAPSQVVCRGVAVGGPAIVMMAGPCAVESEAQLMASAKAAAAAGATFLRGGAYKPRTSPHAFTGLEVEGLKLLRKAADAFGLRVVTEIVDGAHVPTFERYVDMLQVGARNMQNFALLAAVGQSRLPVLLKRGLSATYEEWLLAAEHIRVQGNANIVLCERGIRTFERGTRNTLDLAAVPVLRQLTNLPIVVDPSHGAGRRDAVAALARAGVAAGADGLIIECHPNPSVALSDGPQSLTLDGLRALAVDVSRVAVAVGREGLTPAEPVQLTLS